MDAEEKAEDETMDKAMERVRYFRAMRFDPCELRRISGAVSRIMVRAWITEARKAA